MKNKTAKAGQHAARRIAHRQSTQRNEPHVNDAPAEILDAPRWAETLPWPELNTRGAEAVSLAFLTIDSIAKGGLSGQSFARYEAYKQALISENQDVESVVATLSQFVWDLFERRAAGILH